MTKEIRNNAIAVYMSDTRKNLKYDKSWDWLIPVWSKIRMEMSIATVVNAVSCIDINDIDKFFEIVSNTAIIWCNQNKIKLQ
jgi:hypothetical protein